jgi:Zn-dependent protease
MTKAAELMHAILAILILAFVISFLSGLQSFLSALIISAILIAINLIAKKSIAYFLDARAETRIWHLQRYWVYKKSYFKKPFPAGLILPFILVWISLGYIKWLAVTEFQVYPRKSRVAKRHGLYRYSEMTEFHVSFIAAAGIFASLIAAAFAYLLNFPDFARLSIYFASFNMLPISNLDGSKIFFGSQITWYSLSILCIIGLGYSFFLL